MKSINRAIRSYFEKEGTLTGLDETKVWDIIAKAKNYDELTIDVMDSMASMMGFESYADIPSISEEHKGDIVDNKEYVELLTAYLTKSQGLVIQYNGKSTKINDILFAMSNLDKQNQLLKLISSAPFKKSIKAILPKWVSADVENPYINLGNLFYNKDLTIKERNEIEKSAILNACINNLELNADDRFRAIGLLNTRSDIVSLAELSPKSYKELVKLAHNAGFTVKGLLELLNYNHIDCMEQLWKFGFTITAQTKTAVKVMNKLTDEFVILENEDFKMLYERELLATLTWDNKIPCVKSGRLIQLKMLLNKGRSENDLRS